MLASSGTCGGKKDLLLVYISCIGFAHERLWLV